MSGADGMEDGHKEIEIIKKYIDILSDQEIKKMIEYLEVLLGP
jgi:uncharacterized protein YqeY